MATRAQKDISVGHHLTWLQTKHRWNRTRSREDFHLY